MPIVSPLGSAPIFLSMSADLATMARRRLLRQVARTGRFSDGSCRRRSRSELPFRVASDQPLGETGAEVFQRLSSFILLCVGVSIMWGGIADLVRASFEQR
jgi:multiple antibiotic resistance protein